MHAGALAVTMSKDGVRLEMKEGFVHRGVWKGRWQVHMPQSMMGMFMWRLADRCTACRQLVASKSSPSVCKCGADRKQVPSLEKEHGCRIRVDRQKGKPTVITLVSTNKGKQSLEADLLKVQASHRREQEQRQLEREKRGRQQLKQRQARQAMQQRRQQAIQAAQEKRQDLKDHDSRRQLQKQTGITAHVDWGALVAQSKGKPGRKASLAPSDISSVSEPTAEEAFPAPSWAAMMEEADTCSVISGVSEPRAASGPAKEELCLDFGFGSGESLAGACGEECRGCDLCCDM